MTKFSKIFGILMLCIFAIGVIDADAQSRKKKKRPKKKDKEEEVDDYFDDNSFKQKLWYGGNFTLGLQNTAFAIGIEPMVGYKITDFFSVGPRLSYRYDFVKFSDGGTVYPYKGHSYGAGAFTRVKFLETFFLHAEYMFMSISSPTDADGFSYLDPEDPTRVLTNRFNQPASNIGAGYNSGLGDFGYEIMLYYDVLADPDSQFIPWGFRAGFTYNF